MSEQPDTLYRVLYRRDTNFSNDPTIPDHVYEVAEQLRAAIEAKDPLLANAASYRVEIEMSSTEVAGIIITNVETFDNAE